ncbi:MAG: phosphodiester glycosidase family protein [Mogibacterium sp.]|nr:phosphodiester glycosidase family protein [Mogibacterium sp.]
MDTFVITRVYGEASGDGTEAALQIENKDDNSDQDDGSVNDQNDEGSAADSTESSSGHGPDGAHSSGKGNRPSGGPGHGGKHKRSKSSSGSSSAESSQDSSSGSSFSENSAADSSDVSISNESTADSYSDDHISIRLKEYTVSGTVVHVAEVKADSADYLKTAFAQGSYGKNVTAATSDIAGSVNALLAINGDYYGAQEKGYVIRNGELYRDTAVQGREDLVIYKDGSFGIINESEVTAEQLIAQGAVQTMSFGPALVEHGSVSVDSDDEVGRAMSSNPRTAIGIKADGTYIFMVSDGRTDESEGLSLLQLAEFMKSLGAETAYNLDGGGSSTMVFRGSVVNTPTGGGFGNGSGSERKVSDIVYIGY